MPLRECRAAGAPVNGGPYISDVLQPGDPGFWNPAVSGTRNVFAERVSGGYYVDFTVNREALARYEQDPRVRVKNFDEVNCGYSLEEALNEAERAKDIDPQNYIRGIEIRATKGTPPSARRARASSAG